MAAKEDSPAQIGLRGGLQGRTRGNLLAGVLLALRPKQWLKNALLFVGLIFAVKFTQLDLVLVAVEAFAVFCALASGIYLINDLADVEKDRNHPLKRHRPIASGLVPPRVAAAVAALLLLVALPVAFTINLGFGLMALSYVVLTISYTFWLKHIVIIDVFGLAAGFVIRVLAGAVAISVPISPWLYVCTVLGSLFIGFSKRRHELVLLEDEASNHRPILQEYTPQLLDQLIAVVTPALVMAYSLYTFSAPNLPDNQAMMLTIPFALYGVFRYLYLIHRRDAGGSPEEVLLRDRPLLVDSVLWLLTSVIILYVYR